MLYYLSWWRKVSKLKDRFIKIMPSEKNAKKKRIKNEPRIREMWDSIKHTKVHVKRVAGEGRKKSRKEILKDNGWKCQSASKSITL